MSASIMFRDKKFSPLMWTQFFGAFNDNVLKNAFIVILAFRGVELWGLRAESLVTLATLIFILPFFIFSALAGQLADKFEKDFLIRLIKLAEIIIMVLACMGFYWAHYQILFLVLFLMGLHSTFFGPIKYSSLPELVSHGQLTSANAFVEVGTFIAILAGTLGGGYLVSIPFGEYYVMGLLLLNSILGYHFGTRVPLLKSADAQLQINLNPIPPTLSTLKLAKKNAAVFNSILGISWFWLLGAIILSLLPTITKQALHGNEHIVTLFLAIFTIGIASGAVLCEKLSHGKIEIGLVPIGSLGMSIFLADFSFSLSNWHQVGHQLGAVDFLSQTGAVRLLLDLLGVAICGGLFTVPLYTLMQERSETSRRSRIIGANNIMNAFFMVVGSGVLMLLLQAKTSLSQIILITAVLNLIFSVYTFIVLPEHKNLSESKKSSPEGLSEEIDKLNNKELQSHLLDGVSRTFALTIPNLPPGLVEPVTNAYLLCRIVDTIEDEVSLDGRQKRIYCERFIKVIAGQESAVEFSQELHSLLSENTIPAEHELIRVLPRIIEETQRLNNEQKNALVDCVQIMAKGMAEFQNKDLTQGLEDLAALDRYCYFVAGVVGIMLTRLFCSYSEQISANKDKLMDLSISFGQGLQMTNILKDIWDDQARGVCWLPHDIFKKFGVELSQLKKGPQSLEFKNGLQELLAVTHAHLKNALEYTLLIPKNERGIRDFLLWSLGMAVLTLRNINANAGFQGAAEVKISRRSVKWTLLLTRLFHSNNMILRWAFNLASAGIPKHKK